MLSGEGQAAVQGYARYLHEEQDLSAPTLRNYLSDLRHFAAWCEGSWSEGEDEELLFHPAAVTTPTITAYRSHLRTVLGLKPATINRRIVTLKRYFGWTREMDLTSSDPAKAVKLVPSVPQSPRHLDDKEEAALVSAVIRHGTPRDWALITTALHTGLRAEELCGLLPGHVRINKRSGHLEVYGKRNKHRVVPLNSTAREVLEEYMATLPKDIPCLFPSRKGSANEDGRRNATPITPRALSYIVSRYAALARVEDVSPHDLRHRFGYRMAAKVPLHRLAQIMGHDSLDTTMIYVRGTGADLQAAVEEIAWT
ncbi:MAG: tyrosine-type recombinase/integrase [Chloroflexota bacterium]|nr:tyrosine-type recombinase/integrase [Chloroflexota bacterium]